MLHRRTHPNLDVDGCFGCRIATARIAPSATPTRSPQAAEVKEREERWQKDMPAYRRLRQDGLQPKCIDGSHRLEQLAESPADIEVGMVNVPKSHRSQVDEMTHISGDAA